VIIIFIYLCVFINLCWIVLLLLFS
jgi:hypothetical protein